MDKEIKILELIQQNSNSPEFMDWIGKKIGADPAMVEDIIQQNLNNPDFVEWLFDLLF